MNKENRYLTLAVIGVLAMIVLLFNIRVSPARDAGQWEGTDPEIREWYQNLKQPDAPVASCCGEADAYWADSFEVKDNQVIAIITDEREDGPLRRRHVDIGTKIVIPADKMKFGPNDPQSIEGNKNPTGHGIVFLSRGDYVYCYVAPGGV